MKCQTLIILIGLVDATLLADRIGIDVQSLLLPRNPVRSPSLPPARQTRAGTNQSPNTNPASNRPSAAGGDTPDIGKLSLGSSARNRSTHQKEDASNSNRQSNPPVNPHDHPVHVRASAQGRTIIHVYKGNDKSPTEEFYHKSDSPLHKEFSDPKKIRLVMSSFKHSEHSADGSGRKAKITVAPGAVSRGFATSWSHGAGRKTKESEHPSVPVEVKAASSKIEAPAGAIGLLQGSGSIVVEASNSPSTSPPGSPGKHPPSLPFASIHSKHWKDQ